MKLNVGIVEVSLDRLDYFAMEPLAVWNPPNGWNIHVRSEEDLNKFKDRLVRAWGPEAFDAFCEAGWIKIITH
jgi:hypothetical protein